MASRGKVASRPRAAAVAPVRPAWPVALLAAAGVAIAGYLAAMKLSGGQALLCVAGGGCDLVQASRYATLLGVPTALWGAAAYVAVGVLALLGLTPWRWLAAFLVAVAGASFSAYLTYVSLFVLRAACIWCLVSLAIVVGLVALLVWLRPAPTGRRSPVRPGRVVPLAVVSGVATIVVGAAIFNADPAVSNPYQTALARHLTQTGATMYGVYW